jgi:diaminopimelate decarboxylase
MYSYRNNQLHIESVPVAALARKFGTPLFVYSKGQLAENFQRFDKAFSGVPHLTCFALKANSNGAILSTLAKLGSGVDITSGGELYRSLKAGFSPSRVVYAGIGKTSAEIEYALRTGILMLNVESVEELEAINHIAGRLKKKAAIAFRINPNVDADTHHYITTGKSGSKFGIPYQESLEVYTKASKMANIRLAGIHCHIGSQITNVVSFSMAARRIAGIIKQLQTVGIVLPFIDLGGGLGIQYTNADAPKTPEELAKAVLPVFKDFFGTFILEPGRYLVGNTGALVGSVTYRKKCEGKQFLITDMAMNDLLRPTLYEAYHEIVPGTNPGRAKTKVDVVGPICESGDFMGKERLLPWVGQGELLVVKNAGAYGMAMSSQYNSRARAAEVMVEGKAAKLIRRRESYEDLVRSEM